MSEQAPSGVSTPDSVDALNQALEALRSGYQSNPYPSRRERGDLLRKLHKELLKNQNKIADAISEDFGHRSSHESRLAEVFAVSDHIHYTLRHMGRWMRPQRRKTAFATLPAVNRVELQPLGVIGIIVPWNYPLQLALIPLVTAVAAGNRFMLKPSEFTPATTQVIEELLGGVFPQDWYRVIQGGPDVGAAFSALDFDHLLFTGSTEIGRAVMRAASDTLTPVTLELGGKSPAIIHKDYSMDKAALGILSGKMINAGQSCIAPDYVLVPKGEGRRFADAAKSVVQRLYPTIWENKDYSSIVRESHNVRLHGLIQDAKDQGAEVIVLGSDEMEHEKSGKMLPHLLLNVHDNMKVMEEEIFGPILPVLEYESIDEALAIVNKGPRPLALYYFDHHPRRIKQVIRSSISGGVCINATMLHSIQPDLPFGGVGASGMGAYHGQEGFEAFSHKRAVFTQSRFSLVPLFYPPYGRVADTLLKWLIR